MTLRDELALRFYKVHFSDTEKGIMPWSKMSEESRDFWRAFADLCIKEMEWTRQQDDDKALSAAPADWKP